MHKVAALHFQTIGAQVVTMVTETNLHIEVTDWNGTFPRDVAFFVATHPTGQIPRQEFFNVFWPGLETVKDQVNNWHVCKSKISARLAEEARKNKLYFPAGYTGITTFADDMYRPAAIIQTDLQWLAGKLQEMEVLGVQGDPQRIPVLQQIVEKIGSGRFLPETQAFWAEAARNQLEQLTSDALLEYAYGVHPLKGREYAVKFAQLAHSQNWLRFYPTLVADFNLRYDSRENTWY